MCRISWLLTRIGLLAAALGATGCVSILPERTVAGVSRATGTAPASQLLHRCREALGKSARPYGLLQLAARSAGPAWTESAYAIAPLFVTVVYVREGGPERRSALVRCRVDKAGHVVELI